MTPFCAVHPDTSSVATCPRCGSFACAACWNEAEEVCAPCHAAGHSSARLPWEAGGGFLRTLALLVFQPTRALRRVADGPVGRPIAFATLATALTATLFFLDDVETLELPSPTFALMIGQVMGIFVLYSCLAGLVFFAALRALGARASFRHVVRTVAYLHGLVVLLPLHAFVTGLVDRPRELIDLVIDLGILAVGSRGATSFAHGQGAPRAALAPALFLIGGRMLMAVTTVLG